MTNVIHNGTGRRRKKVLVLRFFVGTNSSRRLLPGRLMFIQVIISLACFAAVVLQSAAFMPPSHPAVSAAITVRRSLSAYFDNWQSLSNDDDGGGVRKLVINKGEGGIVMKDQTVKIAYKGTLIGEDWWTPQDVILCWLKEMQGMDEVAEAFLEHEVSGETLLSEEIFNERFVTEKIGLANKIQCKKLVMAAKRLRAVRDNFSIGTEFDCNDCYLIDPKKRVVRAMRMGIESMQIGEKCHLVCRSDYAYGSEGLRKNDGTVLVPPFATLQFEIELLE